MAIELALDPKDQATYGGPEWVVFDISTLPDVPFDELDALERQLKTLWGIGFARFIAEEMPEETLRAKRGLVWLARKLTGIDTPDLAKFTINAARVRVRGVKPVGDAVPPSQDSSSASSEEETSATESTGLSPGSGKTPATSSRRGKSGS